jgi:hypothetical protein
LWLLSSSPFWLDLFSLLVDLQLLPSTYHKYYKLVVLVPLSFATEHDIFDTDCIISDSDSPPTKTGNSLFLQMGADDNPFSA